MPLLKDDRRGLGAIIIRKMRGLPSNLEPTFPESPSEESMFMQESESDVSMALASASREMMESLKMDDAQKFQTALSNFIQIMSDKKDKEFEV